jgi:signal transduction histidine kinase
LSEHLPTVEADPIQIQQLILNLALNARDAMPNGGKISIKTECSNHAPFRPWWRPSFVVLSVTDNGQGMDDVA